MRIVYGRMADNTGAILDAPLQRFALFVKVGSVATSRLRFLIRPTSSNAVSGQRRGLMVGGLFPPGIDSRAGAALSPSAALSSSNPTTKQSYLCWWRRRLFRNRKTVNSAEHLNPRRRRPPSTRTRSRFLRPGYVVYRAESRRRGSWGIQ
jgi:hypothetical protein